jgi:hypothetical protein
MKMLRLALVLPAFVLLLAAGGAARAETFFASLEKKPSSGAERPASRPESGSPSAASCKFAVRSWCDKGFLGAVANSFADNGLSI